MARVNVETRALAESRFFNLAQDLCEGNRAETIGILVIFWHDSQERGIWKACKEVIQKFIPFRTDQAWAFDVLVAHEYISKCADGEYVIHGNRKHIDALEDRKTAASNGGRASGKVRKEKSNKNNKNEVALHTSEAPASISEPNSIQFNTIQSNTIQKRKEAAPLFDFESSYQRFPRKEGKTKGLAKLKKEICSQEDFQNLNLAIENYAASRRGEDPKFTKHFSTFVSEWRDWITRPNSKIALSAHKSVEDKELDAHLAELEKQRRNAS